MTDQRKPHGGRREGAGRKPETSEPMVKMTVRVPAEHKAVVDANGGPKLVRRLIERWRQEEGK